MERTKVSVVICMILLGMSLVQLGTGCSSFDRSHVSGYANARGNREESTLESDRRSFEKTSIQSELGPAASDSALAARQALKRLEKNLEGKSEREQYYKAKPYLRNDRERIQFLSLDSTAERDRFLNRKGINGDQVAHPPEIQSLIEQNDIAVGMTRQAVRESWGAPDDVDVAGNPMYGNEKWKYSEQTTSHNGFMTERRTVVFESGVVVGWETR